MRSPNSSVVVVPSLISLRRTWGHLYRTSPVDTEVVEAELQSLEDLPARLVDLLGASVVDGSTRSGGDLARQPFAVDADQGCELLAGRRESLIAQGLPPGLDSDLDRIDERPVEIEYDGRRTRQFLERGHGATIRGGV